MGDCGNVVLDFSNDSKTYDRVYLYSHWGGTELPEDVRKALLWAPGRWYDAAYLAADIFKIIIAQGVKYNTGHGITPYRTDFEHPDVVVFLESQKVQIGQKEWTFREYTEQTEATYPEDAELPNR